MRFFDYFFLVLKQFNARKLRTLLTMLAIGVGVGAMFLLISFVLGLQDLVMHRVAPVETLSTADISPGKLSYINDTAVAEIKIIPNVGDVVPIVILSGQGSIDDKKTFADIAINATLPRFITYDGIKIKEGKNYAEGTNEAVITLAGNRLFLPNASIIGSEVYLRKLLVANSNATEPEIAEIPQKIKIVGIVDDDESPAIYMDLSKIKEIAPAVNNSSIKISINDVENMTEVKDKILAMGYEANTVYDMVEETSKLFNYIQATFALFGLIGLFVATIGMFNTMTISLLERTRDIGFMRAFGASKSNVRNIFLTEAALIGFGGGLFGTSIGLIVASLINKLLAVLADKVGSEGFNIFIFHWWMIVVTIVFSLILGIVTGLYPSRRAAKISALEAIRYE